MLALSSFTLIAAALAPERTGASLTGATITLSDSVMLLLPVPLSVTVQVMFCAVLLFASATVLYIRPCISACVKPVVEVKTWVTPSAFHKLTEVGILVML